MSESLIQFAWLVPFLPLLGGIVAAVGGRWLKERSNLPVIVGIGLAFLVSLGLLMVAGPEKAETTIVYQWLQAGSLRVPIEFRVDGLTTVMLSMVTFVSTLVAIFATGYMAGDPGYPRFFAVVGVFVASMTGLVLSNNYLLTYAFWEGVGVCSYLLIGFWHAKPSAAAAAKKAFLVNRIGDVGFAVAIFWMWMISDNHDLSYDVFLSASNLKIIDWAAVQGISFLLFWAATAKSAQVPLYVWLPDAMEGPTPVSALIHAATMVTAGVYLIARSMPLLAQAPLVQITVCTVGAITALLSASIALTQTDLKRVLAYSTVSQLGFMFMALGAGVGDVAQLALVAAIFHLFTHAFFKALLFLGSGSVMHAMGHVIDMRRFSGLRHRMPVTCWTFAVGALALSGIWPFAGFFSKDEILIALRSASHSEGALGYGGIYLIIYWVAIFTAFLTAFYTGRAFFKTFWGPEKLPSPDDPEAAEDAHHHHDPVGDSHLASDTGHGGHDAHFGHESGRTMTVPLIILAVCAFVVGWLFGWTGFFEHQLAKTFAFERLGHPEHHASDVMTPIIGLTVGILGLGLSYLLYGQPSPIPNMLATRFAPLYRASLNKFYIDEFYEATVVRATLVLASVVAFFDTYFVEGLVRLTAWFPRMFGREILAPFQNGLVQFYAAVTALGVAGLLWVLIFS
ncbi:MAG: NADH-quinone oxidoreductase subunit L [Isosphaeraceae bacterium]